MKQKSKFKQTELKVSPEERIVCILDYFKHRDRTYNDWLNDHNRDNSYYEFIDLLFQQNFLCISGLNYIPLSEGGQRHTDIRNGQNTSKIIFVTKEGYSFLTSYHFNQRTLELSCQIKFLTIITIIVSLIALIISIIALFKP